MYNKFTQVDESIRADHHFLTHDDICVFYGEYTARKGYQHSDTNQLIINLKMGMEHKDSDRFHYKSQDMQAVAQFIDNTITGLDAATFVPVPPSKLKSDPLYDDRLVEILRRLKGLNSTIDCREIVYQDQSTRASHECGDGERLSIKELIQIYRIDESQVDHIRGTIIIFDDMLTTGCHFKAMLYVLRLRFPNQIIGGMFIARRVPKAIDISVFSEPK